MTQGEKTTHLAALYGSWTPERLIAAVSRRRDEYRPESLAIMEEELRKRGIAPEAVACIVAGIQQSEQEQIASLAGVRGWLLFFVAILVIHALVLLKELLDAAALVPLLLEKPPVATNSSTVLVWGYMAGLAVLFPFCVFVIVAMLLKKPYAPGAARWYLLFALISMATGAFLSSEPAGAVFPGLGAALWLAYLTTSKRVAATYGSSDRTGG
jgi:cytochrome bd-type quinol oxidase subunit 1